MIWDDLAAVWERWSALRTEASAPVDRWLLDAATERNPLVPLAGDALVARGHMAPPAAASHTLDLERAPAAPRRAAP